MNFFKHGLSFNKFLLGIFILFFLIILGGFGKMLWQFKGLSEQNITVLSPNAIASGGSAIIEIYAKDIHENKNVESGDIAITLENNENDEVAELYEGELLDGKSLAGITLPKLVDGFYVLRVKLKSSLGKDEITKTININSGSRIFISTDRPLYKPAQTMNFRALVLAQTDLKPAADKEVVVSINNPKGDTIFREKYTTSEYGIIGDSFGFADELAFGDYKLSFTADGQTNEKTVSVKQFTLPKYEVKITPEHDLSEKPEIISGYIEAKYFFGKPVTSAKTEITLNIDNNKLEFSGTTDSSGRLNFTFTPVYKGEVNNISISASVVDATMNAVSNIIGSKVSTDGILIELIPESGKLKPGLDNRILLISSRPDGTPLKTTIFMTGEKLREFVTNEFGIASFTYRPKTSGSISRFNLNVRDEGGSALNKTFSLQNEVNEFGHLIIKPEKTVLNGKETLKVLIKGTNDMNTRIELLQNGQVVYGNAVKIINGSAETNIKIPSSVFGVIEVRALQTFYTTNTISNNRRTWGINRRPQSSLNSVNDSKFIIVDQDNSLNISITKDKESYRPGEEARVAFTVTNEAGSPENSALGIKIVDEALLALEADDTFSRLLILVDEKIRNNAKTINGLDWQKVIEDETLKTRDEILAAMFLSVPRDSASLSKIEKNNKITWDSFNRDKKKKFTSLLILFIAVFIFYALKLWWRITGAAVKQKAGTKLWGGSFLVAILSMFATSLFIDDHYYSIWNRIGGVFRATAENLWETIIKFPHTYLVLLILFIGTAILAWNYRAWLKAYMPVVKNYIIVFAGLVFFSIAHKLDLGLDSELWVVILMFGYISLLAGVASMLAIFYLNKYIFTVGSWIYVTLTGVILFFVLPAIIPFYIIIIIFNIIHASKDHSDHEADSDVDKIERLKNQLEAQGKNEKEIELEIALLRREVLEGGSYTAIGRVVVSLLTLIGLIVSIFILYHLLFGGIGLLSSGTPAIAQSTADQMLWSGFEENVQSATGLGNTDPRAMTGSVINIILGFVGLGSILLITIFGLRWQIYIKNNKIRKSSQRMIIIGVIVFIVCFMAFGIAQFTIGALYSATGATDGGGGSGFSMPSFSRESTGSAGFGGGGPSGADTMLWGGFEDNVQSATGLGGTGRFNPRHPLESLTKKSSDITAPTMNEEQVAIGKNGKDDRKEEFKKAGRVRKFFPETMFWQTSLIAENGRAELTIPVKDSITRWKLSALANSLTGKIGAANDALISFQDFFINFDLPYNLTRDDELELPIDIFNYLPTPQKIKIAVRDDPWFTLLSENNREFLLSSNETKTIYLKFKIDRFGDFVLRIDAEGTKLADAIEKSLRVLPFGQRITQTVASEELKEDESDFMALIPENTITGTEKITVKIFPSVLAEIISGLENILRFPRGCFEQTSSALYPDILVLKYLKKTGQDKPKIKKKAEDFIEKGVQRLLTYEIPPGGFSYYGRKPAETILTAYGLMEFSEMRGVVFVDEDIISRAKNALLKQQNSNGSFKFSGSHRGGFSGGSDELAKNAYVIWALSESDPRERRLKRSVDYLKNNMNNLKESPYALALATNAFINYAPNESYTASAIKELKQAVTIDENRRAHIKLKKPTHYGSYGRYGNIEVTALAAIAFSRGKEYEFSSKLTETIIAYRDGRGTWGSTQATILALKAIVENESAKKSIDDNNGEIKITFNGGDEVTLNITPDNSEVVQYIDFTESIQAQNTIKIKKSGQIRGTIQIIKDYYREWKEEDNTNESGGLSVDRRYGTSRRFGAERKIIEFGVGKQVSLYLDLKSTESIKNAVAEVPIPAGFTVNSAEIACQVKNKTVSNCPAHYSRVVSGISRFENMGDRIILYFDLFSIGSQRSIEIPLTPKYEGSFKLMPVRFYAYYEPGREDYSTAIDSITVGKILVKGDIIASAQKLIPPSISTILFSKCSDTDHGINYYVSGTITTFLNDGTKLSYVDKCNGKILSEYNCNAPRLETKTYTCPYGCENGACKRASTPTTQCTDSDGGLNYFTKGTTNSTRPDGTKYSSADRCSGNKLIEYYCNIVNGNNVNKLQTYTCPNGCVNGACKQ